MVKIDRFRDAWHLINIAQETIQIEIVADAMLVAFEMRDIHRIKADECCPQANISLCKPITCQIAMLTEDLLQPRQRGKDVFYRVIIGLLTGSEARFIDAIVNVVINPAVQFVDLVAQFWGIVVPGFCPCASNAVLNMRMISADSLLTIVWFFLSHKTGTVTRPL